MDLCIVDFYTDEPAGLGVPPYLGTVPRYVYGAAVAAGARCWYINIDDLRSYWGRRATTANITKNRRGYQILQVSRKLSNNSWR